MKDYDSFLKNMSGYEPPPENTYEEPEEQPEPSAPNNGYMASASEPASPYESYYEQAAFGSPPPQPAQNTGRRYSADDYEKSSILTGSDVSIRERINASKAASEERVLPGLIGSLAGAALGTAVWCLFGMAGYIAWLGALAIVAGAFFGYLLPAKNIGKTGALIIGVIILFSVYVGNRLTFSIQLHKEIVNAREELELEEDEIPGVGDIFSNANYYIDTLDIRKEYDSDMGISYLITAVASVSFVVRRKRKGLM